MKSWEDTKQGGRKQHILGSTEISQTKKPLICYIPPFAQSYAKHRKKNQAEQGIHCLGEKANHKEKQTMKIVKWGGGSSWGDGYDKVFNLN